MAVVSLQIGDMVHDIACRDGGEDRLRQAGAMIDAHWATARRASGQAGPTRTLLLCAIMLADALIDAREAPPPETPDAAALAQLAERLESLAATLEADTPGA